MLLIAVAALWAASYAGPFEKYFSRDRYCARAAAFNGIVSLNYDGGPDVLRFSRREVNLGGFALVINGSRGWQYARITLPIWMLLAVVAVPAGFLEIRAFVVLRRRLRKGHCRRCGYDLTGNVSGRCPECGSRAGMC